MQKLVYLLYLSIENQRGVWQKILDQCNVLSGFFDVDVCVLSPIASDVSAVAHSDKFNITVYTYGNRIEQASAAVKIVGHIDSFRPDAIYFRYGTYFPVYEYLFRKYPTIVELNSNSRVEIRGKNTLKNLFHKYTAERVYKLSSGFVTVTDEIKSQYTNYWKPSIAIGNGIDLSRIATLHTQEASKTRLAFMGSPGARWHGVEDIVAAAEAVYPMFDFDIIGYSGDDFPDAPANVHFHGYLTPEKYIPILAGATAAIGSLALYKNDMNQGSTLKAREYLAMGLPIILGHKDVDFPSNVDYILTLPNHSGAFGESRREVETFVDRWRGFRVNRGAIGNLDTRVKEEIRARFIQNVIEGT